MVSSPKINFFGTLLSQLAYSPPRQRQKWGEVQSLPRVDWGDLFFDLHYVAATYNISYILVKDPTWEGLLYAAGTFFAVQMIWTRTTARSSRFVTEDDLYHRILKVATLVVLATSVLHIRSVDVMSRASTEISIFVFSLSLVLEDLLEGLKCLEEYVVGIGQKVAVQNAARISLYNVAFSSVFHIAAMTVAALEFFPRSDSSRRLAEAGEENLYKEDAYDYVDKTTTHLPIILILLGYWAQNVALGLRVIFFFPKNGKHKEM